MIPAMTRYEKIVWLGAFIAFWIIVYLWSKLTHWIIWQMPIELVRGIGYPALAVAIGYLLLIRYRRRRRPVHGREYAVAEIFEPRPWHLSDFAHIRGKGPGSHPRPAPRFEQRHGGGSSRRPDIAADARRHGLTDQASPE